MISKFLNKNFAKYKDRPLFGTRKSDSNQFEWSTYQDIYIKSQHLASFLSKNITIPPADVFPFGTVCICSENCEEWMIADFACSLLGLVSVGFHSSWPLEESITIANDIYASAAIVGSKQLDYFLKIAEKQKSLKLIICIDDENAQKNSNIISLSDIYKIPLESFETLPNDYHTIIYSSGTTGSPKGLPVTRKRWIYDAEHGPFQEGERSVCLSFSSLAHGMDRGIVWQLLHVGGQIAFARNDFEGILQDAKTIEPSLIMSMPHLWNDLYHKYKDVIQKLIVEYLEKVEKITSPSQNLIDLLVNCCEEENQKNPIITDILKEAKETILNSVGTKCKVIGTGGSSISDQVLHFLKDIFKEAQIFNAYGTTEVPGISTNGRISDNIELKLVDCPECGYVSTETDKVGEIVVKMPDMVTAYWGNREESIKSTRQNFKDGWYYTQDIGRLDSFGNLSIIDRKSDLVELYVDGRSEWFPTGPLENLYLSSSKLIKNIYLHGDRMQSYMVAVVVPIESEKFSRHQILNELRETAKAHNLCPSKIPRGIVISDHEWTPSTGELSPTNKLRRSVLLKNFKGQIDSEYTRITVLEEKKEKIKKDENFDYIDYKFMCDDEEDSQTLDEIFRPIRDSILKLREIAVTSREKMEKYEEKVAQETQELKTKCFKENDQAFLKIEDDVSFSNFFNTVSQNKELVTEACKDRENARYAGDPDLQAVDGQINRQIHHLVDVASEIGESLPYQITCGLVKLSPAQIKDRKGNCLSESQAPSSWEVWCDMCGDLIEVGKHGEGTPRYKCLDCSRVYCCSCYEKLAKLKVMAKSHKKWKIPFECFTNNHYLSKENMKFLRTELNTLRSSKSLSEIFEKIHFLYGNRILIGRNENCDKIVTYNEAHDHLADSGNKIIQMIKNDIDQNDQEIIHKLFLNKIDDWPVIVHVKKDEIESVVVWNTMYNGGRLIIDN